jgi:hypothetical protein
MRPGHEEEPAGQPIAEEASREDVEAWRNRVGVPAPPVAGSRSPRVLRLGDDVFASWPARTSPYDFPELMQEAFVQAEDGDWLLGIDGHGAQSWAFQWLERRGPLLVGLQSPIGGAFADPEQDRAAIEGGFEILERMHAALDQAEAVGSLPDDRMLVVIDSELESGRLAWIRRGTAWDDALWQEEPMAAFVGLMELEALSAPNAARRGEVG